MRGFGIALLSVTALLLTQIHPAVGTETPQGPTPPASSTSDPDTCTIAKPTLDKIQISHTGIWFDATTSLDCDSGSTHPIMWVLYITEVPSQNPTYTECYNVGGQQVIGSRSSGETISFGKHGLTTWTEYEFRLGVGVSPDIATVTPRYSSEGTEKCATATPAQSAPPKPYLSATGQTDRVQLYTKFNSFNLILCAPITKWQYTYKTSGGSWAEWVDVNTGHQTSLTVSVTGLENGTSYEFKTRAVNRAGAGPDSRISYATPKAPTNSPPTTTPTTPTTIPTTTSPINTTTPVTGTAAAQQTPPTQTEGSQPIKDLFTDDNDSVHEFRINLVAHKKVIKPCNTEGTLFCPQDPITRVLMAVALTRAMELETPTNPTIGNFVDTAGHTHENSVRAIAAEGITVGCNAEKNLFCPNDPVTRGQMATFFARALNLETPTDPSVGAFSDIVGSVHEDHIRAIAAEGITAGCDAEKNLFCPNDPVTRGQMATFLVRAFTAFFLNL